MPLSCVWKFRPTRAVLLGTTDPGSVLYRLPKSDGVLNIILGFVVLYCQGEVTVRTCVACDVRGIMCAGPQAQSVRGSGARQPDAVADGARGVLCARPRERNGWRKYTVPCSVALFWSSAQLMACQVFCMVLFWGVLSAECLSEIEKYSAEVRCAVWC